MDNAALAERLEAFAALLDLNGSGHYTVRAYRRAADLIRATPADVAALVRQGRAQELAGIGPGIETRLRELVETGRIAELDELEAAGAAGARRRGGAARRLDEADARARARARDQDAAGAARGRGGGTARQRPGHRAEDGRPDQRGPFGARDREAEARDDPEPGARPRGRGGGRARRRAGGRPAARLRALDPLRRRRPAGAPRRGRGAAAARRGAGARRAARRRRHRGRLPDRGRRRDGRELAARARPRDRVAGVGCGARQAHRRAAAAGAARARRPSRSARPARARRCPGRPPRPHDGVRRQGDRRGDGPGGAGARLRVPGDLRPHAQRPRRSGARCRRPAAAGGRDRGGERAAGAVPDPPRQRVRHPPGRVARPPRRRAGGARMGADQPPRGPARAARADHGPGRRGDAASA